MLNKDQAQIVGDGATAVQAAGNVSITQVGLSYSEVRDVALDVFRSNFYQLAGPAMETARARAEEITESFLKKLQADHPEGFSKGQDPDFQHALFTVQKEYARNGDKELGDLLVDLLVDRSKQDQRDILQIVLNESLNTAPKLTDSQLAVLAIVFLFRYTQNHGIGTHAQLGLYFDKNVSPFASRIVKGNSSYQHLEFTGCGSIQMGEISLEQCLEAHYQGQFLKGFEIEEISNRGISVGHDQRFFIPCLNDATKFQVRANNRDSLEKHLDANGLAQDDKSKILGLFEHNKMSHSEIRDKCIAIRPYMANVFDVWSDSPMKSFTLTSVGMAIGHANLKRLVGEFASLAIWIN
ncbi:MAG: hypothetical protein DCE87_02090 [Betaproteobacteria bacterium]|jgi:hypothetical protein|nr:MAG: hypothetical protein DCE87_02090 [Betaproteobacteria bacterium]PZO26274.1 MAG: hypothetical protein DCE89_00410 [Betaproteobacteria bacterium]PZO32241.1 MAG: hypothetical protein DCE88_01735 [Betaproteobacteria bacterium]